MPRVSFIVPTYNRADLLPLTLNSILAQTYEDIEILVVDNASSDATPDLMKSYQTRGVKYVRKPVNKGLIDSFYLGFQLSTGEFINFLDSDDIIAPTKIEKQVNYLDVNPSVDLVYTRFNFIDQHGRLLQRSGILPQGKGEGVLKPLMGGMYAWHGSILYRRSCLEQVGLFDEKCDWVSDWEILIRLAIHGRTFGCLQETLGSYRLHLGNNSRTSLNNEHAALMMLEKTFAVPQLPSSVAALKTQAYVLVNTWCAFGYYRSRAWEDAKRCLREAYRLLEFDRAQALQLIKDVRATAFYLYVEDPVAFICDVLDHLPEELAHLSVKRSALTASMHLCSAMRWFNQGEISAGQQALDAAFDAYPAMLQDTSDFRSVVGTHAIMSLADDPTEFVNRVFDHLPPRMYSLMRVRNQVISEVDMAIALAYRSAGREHDAAKMAVEAIRLNPSMICRRSILAILSQSLKNVSLG